MTARQLTRDELLALPPTIPLATLAECYGVSEPTIRASHRSGELAALGIRIVRLGQQWRVVTQSVWDALGLNPDRGSTESAGRDAAGPRAHIASALRAVSGREGT